MTVPNAALAARIRSEIVERPHHHDQQFYIDGVDVLAPGDSLTNGTRPDCGTTLCVAGFAAHLTGYTIVRLGKTPHEDTVLAYQPGKVSGLVVQVARAELGLSTIDAEWLFSGLRTRDEVLTALGQLAGGAARLDPTAITAAVPSQPLLPYPRPAVRPATA
ncbi:hypothetical protein [Streptomyces sp. NPDC007088]|uniref:hypothetical protein n=1 Tax=Streptomyces sp. NPDC007088 TaxID=3364773 RepID=UPI003673666C